jgi:predicted ATPase
VQAASGRRERLARRAFIGRDRGLAELLAALLDAIEGRGSLFLITGDAGIGKTALAEQLAEHATDHGARVLSGRGWDGGGRPPYWIWSHIVGALIGDVEPEVVESLRPRDLTHLALLAPELAERPGQGAVSITGADSDAARFYLFEATATLLRQASNHRPLAIILDDLFANDAGSLLLLRYLARDISSSRMLLVATYREPEATRSPDPVETLAHLLRNSHGLHLQGLGRQEVALLIARESGTEPREGKVAAICEASDGNPLFVREITRLVAGDPLDQPGRPAIQVPENRPSRDPATTAPSFRRRKSGALRGGRGGT